MNDVLGGAIFDYYSSNATDKLWIHNKYGRKEEMPVEIYFREENDLTELELCAISICKGTVLDIGAGAGSISLILQQKNIDVTALEISQRAAAVMKMRGVKKILCEDIFQFEAQKFDTLLLLMNGIGLCGTTDRLRQFLQHAKALLHDSGQLIFDSSDVAYLYKGKLAKPDNYYGEIMYQYEYKKQKSQWFTWLYIDQHLLQKIATEEGWKTEIIFEDGHDQFVARLTIS